MAFNFVYAVIAMATLVVLDVEARCTNKVSLIRFDIIDKRTNNVLSKLPLKGEKNLKVAVAVRVAETLNSPSYSSKLRLEATVHTTIFGSQKKAIPCPSQLPTCEFRRMSCNEMKSYLGLKQINCPLTSGQYSAVENVPNLGDLSHHIQPAFLQHFVKSVDVTGYLDVWDDRTGEHVTCIRKTVNFYKDW